MGGTFDPIHHGHLVAASEVANRFDLDEVVFVPTGKPQGKHEDLSPAEHRYLMCVVATASNPDRKSTRLNSSHVAISYAVFCLKKKRSAKRSRRAAGSGCGAVAPRTPRHRRTRRSGGCPAILGRRSAAGSTGS